MTLSLTSAFLIQKNDVFCIKEYYLHRAGSFIVVVAFLSQYLLIVCLDK